MAPHELRFLAFLARNCLSGVLVGWSLLAALLLSDVAQLGTLVLASPDRLIALLLLGGGFAVTFGSLAMGTAIFLLPRR